MENLLEKGPLNGKTSFKRSSLGGAIVGKGWMRALRGM